MHTVAIWTFPFHKISGFVRVILKGNFKQLYRPKVSIFWSENSDLLFSFSFYFLKELSNPLLFAHCCCYLFQWLDISKLWFDAKMWLKWLKLFEIASTVCKKALDLTTPAKNRRKMRIIDFNFQVKKLIPLACRVV